MKSQDKPNVLLINVDQWSGRLLGIAGHPCIMTPTLNQLARNGVRYTNAYSATPMCIPARRALMTGTTARTHGDRVFDEKLSMPADLPTLPQTFHDAGYQTFAVGKIHVYPQRARIGFDDVILNEEGRHHLGLDADDYELFLAAQGYAGQEYTHAMATNDYVTRPWHLPEHLHHTHWSTQQMSMAIKRRDPTRPAFWYLSYNFPHPPIIPLATYMQMYEGVEIPAPVIGEWARDFEKLPYVLKKKFDRWPGFTARELHLARQGFYALCTHIDHQIRLLVGLLHEEGLLSNTIMAFTSDHGDILGDHGLFAKSLFYEDAAHIPLIVVPTADYHDLGHHLVDDRLVELRDIMPTLLEMAGIPVPSSVEGISLLSDERRDVLYGETFEGIDASRMVVDGRYKLIYYAAGNHMQIFDLQTDPDELHNRVDDPDYAGVRERLTARLIDHFYGTDCEWLEDGKLVGLPEQSFQPGPERSLIAQRGWRFM